MKEYYFILTVFSLHVLVQCLIPNLVVRKVDKTLIAKTRQETMEMCKIFTEENEKKALNHAAKLIKSYRPNKKSFKRFKRDLNDENIELEEHNRNKRDVKDNPIKKISDNKTDIKIEGSKNLEILKAVNDKPLETNTTNKVVIKNDSYLGFKKSVIVKPLKDNKIKTDDISKNENKVGFSNIVQDKPINKNRVLKTDDTNKDNVEYESVTMKFAVNPVLNPEDVKRVESIVDKLYDDLEEKGEKIIYRQVYMTTSAVKLPKNKTSNPSRRFDFAPAILTGPQVELKEPVAPTDAPFDSKARWKHGIIPYYVDFNTYDAHLVENIMQAFDYVEQATCIRLQKLREKPTDKKSLESVPWLYISNPTGIRQCVHSNEKMRINGVLMTVFGYDCLSLGDIVHEVMHILGFSHEHLRSDRDQYISILWENIKPGYKKYFDRSTRGMEYELESLPYDYSSILHYPHRAFSKNGKSTIIAESGIQIGQREGLSEIDVEKVALIYSNECVARNRQYLLETCPSVVKAVTEPINVTQQEIEEYFQDRLWPFGIINYKLRDNMEFTVEERENIKAVFRHIEEETCIQFKDIAADDHDNDEDNQNKDDADSTLESKEYTDEDNQNKDDADSTLESKEDTDEDNKNKDDADSTLESKEDTTSNTSTTTQGYETNQEKTSTSVPEETTLSPDINSSADNDTDIQQGSSEKVPKIIITKSKRPAQTAKDSIENEIDNEITLDNRKNFKNMNITMKKKLLRIARAKQKKQRRHRRDVPRNSISGRRHANSILELTRSPALTCDCPEPGAPSGKQVLEIGAGCFNSVNDLLHFFVHVLGLDHQHNMHDRDNFLHIIWNNLTPDLRKEMENKLPVAASAGFSYDYQSVMHFPWLQIKNGKTNIMYPIWNDGWAMGHWQGLSATDVHKLNMLYFNQCRDRQQQEEQ